MLQVRKEIRLKTTDKQIADFLVFENSFGDEKKKVYADSNSKRSSDSIIIKKSDSRGSGSDLLRIDDIDNDSDAPH